MRKIIFSCFLAGLLLISPTSKSQIVLKNGVEGFHANVDILASDYPYIYNNHKLPLLVNLSLSPNVYSDTNNFYIYFNLQVNSSFPFGNYYSHDALPYYFLNSPAKAGILSIKKFNSAHCFTNILLGGYVNSFTLLADTQQFKEYSSLRATAEFLGGITFGSEKIWTSGFIKYHVLRLTDPSREDITPLFNEKIIATGEVDVNCHLGGDFYFLISWKGYLKSLRNQNNLSVGLVIRN